MTKPSIDSLIKEIDDIAIHKILDILRGDNHKNIPMADYIRAHQKCMKANEASTDGARKLLEHISSVVEDYLTGVSARLRYETGEGLVQAFIKETDKFKILICWMTKIFKYVDQMVKTQKSTSRSLAQIAVDFYCQMVIQPIKSKIFVTINAMIQDDRLCKVVSRENIIYMLEAIEWCEMDDPKISREDERIVITGSLITLKSHQMTDMHEQTKVTVSRKTLLKEWFASQREYHEAFIKEKSNREYSSMSAPEYIRSFVGYLRQEDERFMYIPREFQYRIEELNYDYAVRSKAKDLAKQETGIMAMLRNDKQDELREAYLLFIRAPECIKHISNELSQFISMKGGEIYNNKEISKDPTKFIPKLIELKLYIDRLVEKCFENNLRLQDAKNKAFSLFMNKEIYSKQLANFCDYLMCVLLKGKKEDDLEELLCDVINLFRCLHNKIVFQNEYSKKLANRLIQNKSLSVVAEKSLITKLKAEQGVTFVNKWTSMLEDLDRSTAEMDLFRKLGHRGNPAGVSFNVRVLQHGAWQIDNSKFLKLLTTPQLNHCVQEWEKFYQSRYKTHRLRWIFGSGTLEVKPTYLEKPYQVSMTVIQYLILLQLEQKGRLKAGDLAGYIGENERLCMNELTALVFHPSFNRKGDLGKGIISTSGKKKEVEPCDEVGLNEKFSAESLRLSSVPLFYKKSTNESSEQERIDSQNIKSYQNILLDATITRIMKGRIGKVTTHSELVTEVAKQIDLFVAQPPEIKERIECLIEKMIVKRNDIDKSCYEYIS